MIETKIYSYQLNTDQGIKTGRVEAADHRQALSQAILSSNCTVYGGNMRLLENQERARNEKYFALKDQEQS